MSDVPVSSSASAPDPASGEPLGSSALPPVFDPARWEEYPVFRETFLLYVSVPEYAQALRTVGAMLLAMVLEVYGQWPAWPESTTRMEVRAALADLRQLEGFLASVGREHALSSLTDEDARLSQRAASLAHELGTLAGEIERALAG